MKKAPTNQTAPFIKASKTDWPPGASAAELLVVVARPECHYLRLAKSPTNLEAQRQGLGMSEILFTGM